METILRMTRTLHTQMVDDLSRRHPRAAERVGFAFGRQGSQDGLSVVILSDYSPVADGDYLEDETVGARINSASIRGAMQRVLDNEIGCFHVHAHLGKGMPWPSPTDWQGIPPIIKSFRQMAPQHPHGFVILTDDGTLCVLWTRGTEKPVIAQRISICGFPLTHLKGDINEPRRKALAAVFSGA